MTRDEAIEILEHNWSCLVNADYTEEECNKALHMAIEALEHLDNIEAYMHDFDVTEEEAIKALERKKGEWIVQDGMVVCSECFEPNLETNFCPNCGARMDERREE